MRESSINWSNQAEVKAYRQAYYQKRKALKKLEKHPIEVTPTEPPKPRKKTVAVIIQKQDNNRFKTAFERVSTREAVERVLDKIFDSVVEKGLQRPTVNVVNTTDGIEARVTYFQDCEITFGVGKKGVTFAWGKRYLSGTDIEILKALDQNCEAILKGTARVVYDGPFTKYSDDADSIFEDF